MRERARRKARGETAGDFVAEHEGSEHVSAGTARRFADREHAGQYLQRRLTRDEAQPLAQFDCAAGGAVQQCRRARIHQRPAARIDRCPDPAGGGQPLAQLRYLGPLAAGEDDAQRVEQGQLCVMPHRLGDVLPARRRDKCCQFLDLPSHQLPPSLRAHGSAGAPPEDKLREAIPRRLCSTRGRLLRRCASRNDGSAWIQEA